MAHAVTSGRVSVANAAVRHRSASTAPEETRAAYRRSQLAFYRKHHPRWAPLLSLYLELRRHLGIDRGPRTGRLS